MLSIWSWYMSLFKMSDCLLNSCAILHPYQLWIRVSVVPLSLNCCGQFHKLVWFRQVISLIPILNLRFWNLEGQVRGPRTSSRTLEIQTLQTLFPSTAWTHSFMYSICLWQPTKQTVNFKGSVNGSEPRSEGLSNSVRNNGRRSQADGKTGVPAPSGCLPVPSLGSPRGGPLAHLLWG